LVDATGFYADTGRAIHLTSLPGRRFTRFVRWLEPSLRLSRCLVFLKPIPVTV